MRIEFLLSLFLIGCGTVSPDQVNKHAAMADGSAPSQYAGKKWLLFQNPDHSGVITKNALDRYNNLIADYRLQYREAYKVTISPNDGISDYQDKYGNKLYRIDAQSLETFERLSQWAKDGVLSDTLWARVKGGFGP